MVETKVVHTKAPFFCGLMTSIVNDVMRCVNDGYNFNSKNVVYKDEEESETIIFEDIEISHKIDMDMHTNVIFVKMKNKPICVISIENISDGFLISSYNHISNERDFEEARKLIKSE